MSEADKQCMCGYECGCSPSASHVIYFTPGPPGPPPLSRKEFNNGLRPTSLESYLREAARTFPNIPSIIRKKQRRTVVVSDSNNNASKTDEEATKEVVVVVGQKVNEISEKKTDDEAKSSEKDKVLDGEDSQLPG